MITPWFIMSGMAIYCIWLTGLCFMQDARIDQLEGYIKRIHAEQKDREF